MLAKDFSHIDCKETIYYQLIICLEILLVFYLSYYLIRKNYLRGPLDLTALNSLSSEKSQDQHAQILVSKKIANLHLNLQILIENPN